MWILVAVRQERAVDGFRLAYERAGPGPGSPAVLLLHGWPGDRTDYREVVPLLPGADVITPDLRGFGESDKHQAEPGREYTAGPDQDEGAAGPRCPPGALASDQLRTTVVSAVKRTPQPGAQR
jgi:pimeloyl-ACP methyl ester carboxylesterase